MEVHHPSHIAHKKKWTEYILEFLMLFFAVFLGFLAENLREEYIEEHRGQQFMESLTHDLKLDTAYLNASITEQNHRILAVDSVLDYFNKNRNEKKVSLGVMKQMRRTTWDQVFIHHSSTIDQLNNSGGMRLIHNRPVVDTIQSYYQQVRRASARREEHDNNRQNGLAFIQKIVDGYDNINYYNILYEGENPLNDSMKISIDSDNLNEYLNFLITQKRSTINDKKMNLVLKEKAIRLIALIKKVFQIKNE